MRLNTLCIAFGVVLALASSAHAQAVSCDLFGNLKSIDSGVPVTVSISNNTSNYRSVMWLDYNGSPVHYKDLQAGESYAQETYVGHPWMIVDGPGNCIQVFAPEKGSSRFRISR